MKYIDLIVSILAGLAVCIPIVVKLGQVIKTAIQEKNWARIVEIAMDFMTRRKRCLPPGPNEKFG